MENKRISRIFRHFDEFVEEKRELVHTLDRIENLVFSCVGKVNNPRVNQQDLLNIYNYQLKLLQKLSEFTYEMEVLESECPVEVQEYSPDTPYGFHSVEDGDNNTQTHFPLIDNIDLNSNGTEQPTHDCEISRLELQHIRQAFKTISEKLGLDEQNILSMRDYYAKPSDTSNLIFDQQDTCSSEQIPKVEYSDDQIPEKDTCSKVTSMVNMSNVNENECNNSTESVSKGTDVLIECEDVYVNPDPELHHTLSNYLNLSTITSDNHRESAVNTSNRPCTALEKLNNLRSIERKDPQIDIKPLEWPDLKLKLTDMKVEADTVPQNTTVIRNFSSQCKQKTNNVTKSPIALKRKSVPGEGAECMFGHIDSPSEFYIHLVDEECAEIDNISDDIKKYAETSEAPYGSKDEAQRDIQKYGVAYITQYNNWYRIEVLDWWTNDHVVLVHLVDLGSKHVVSYLNLRKLTEKIAELPMLAICCHFPLMYPPNSSSSNRLTQWPEETVHAMMELSGLFDQEEKIFKIVYSLWNSNLNSLAIDLYDKSTGNEHDTVGQILMNHGLAVQITEEEYDDNLALDEFLQDVDTLEHADNINEAITGYDARDEARICRFTKSDGTCFKGKNCKLEHAALSTDGFTTDKDFVFKEAMYSILLPKLGEIVMVLITSYKNICNFFVQIVRIAHSERDYIVDRDFHFLKEELNSPKTVKSYQCFKVAPAVGEIVLVKHWSSIWCRAIVREFETNAEGEPNNFQVYTVDYGENLSVVPKDLRKIKPHFLQLPFQAVECYIYDHQMKSNCHREKAKIFFDRFMYYRNFMATTMSSSLPLKVNLQSKNGAINIGKSLKDNGLAERKQYDINPSDECFLSLY